MVLCLLSTCREAEASADFARQLMHALRRHFSATQTGESSKRVHLFAGMTGIAPERLANFPEVDAFVCSPYRISPCLNAFIGSHYMSVLYDSFERRRVLCPCGVSLGTHPSNR